MSVPFGWKTMTLFTACLLASAALGLRAQDRPVPRAHGIMRPDPAAFRRWQMERKLAPQAAHAKVSGLQPAAVRAAGAVSGAPPASFTLLQDVPDYLLRNQGDCGSCWVWASTALTEVALNAQYGIVDRLSVQYFQSNELEQAACGGGSLTEYCDWYNNNLQFPPNPNPGVLVPWSNAHGAYVDGASTWFQTASTVPPGGVALHPQYSGLSLAHQTLDVGDPSVTTEQAIADIQAALLNNQAVGFSFFTNFSANNGFDAFWLGQPESAIWINNYEGVTVDWPYSGWGGHMVTIVGWDATDSNPGNQYWIVLNQWGVTSTRPDQCFRIPMNMDYGATYTMVDYFGNPYLYACYAFETLTLAAQGATPAGPAALAAGTLPLPAGPVLAGSVMTLVPSLTAGSPPFTYQWQANLGHGFQIVTGATSEALSLPNDVTPGYGVLDSTWDGAQVSLTITGSAGSALIGPVTVHVAGGVQNPDSGFESGPGTSQWTWNDTPSSNPIVQNQPTHGGTYAAALTGEGFPAGRSGTLTSALVTLPADTAVPVFAAYYLCLSTAEFWPLVHATCTIQVVDPSGTVLKVLKTHTDLDVDHLAYLPERFDLTALNQGGTRIALQAVWSDPDALTLFLLDDAEILTGAGATGSPALAGFAPAGGAPGTPVVITGTNFTGASLVVFGRDYAGGFTVDSDAQITALVPWDGATGPITVTTPAGTASSGASFFVSPSFISSPSCYGYSYNYGTYPEMSPDVAGVQDPVLLYGFNFTGATAVTFGGVPATQFTVTSNTQINVTVPAGAQNGPIVVTAPGGSVSTQGSFSVATPVAPFLAGAVPAAANPDATVTLSGTGLTTVNKVTFNGMPAVLFSMINDSTLTAVVPFGAGSGPVAVTNPAGSAAIPFTVLPPAIASVTPLTDAYPGTGVDIYGSGFLDASSVTIGGVAASFTIVSNTLITAVIPPSLRPIKTVNVIVVSPEGTSAPGLLNVYVPGPTVATVSPDSGPAGTTVTFTGQYLTNTYSVVFGGGCSASFNLIDDGHLTAVVPAGAMTGTLQISVLTGGNWTSSVPFTVQKPEVTIGQAPDNLLVGTTFAFSASATGTTASTVTWSVADGPAGGTIDASGLYTAPATPGQYYVIATSTSAPAVHSTVAVPVHSACLDPALTGSSGQPTVVDLAYFMAAMGSKVGDSNYNPLADLNGDGVIDNADLALFLAAF